MKHVLWAATAWGYVVQVMDGSNTVHRYTAGNCRHESQTYIAPDSDNVVPLDQLRKFAEQTAGEIASDFGAERIEEDDDLEAGLIEELQPIAEGGAE